MLKREHFVRIIVSFENKCITKEYVAVMVAVPVTMDGISNRIVQVILVSIETYLIQRVIWF